MRRRDLLAVGFAGAGLGAGVGCSRHGSFSPRTLRVHATRQLNMSSFYLARELGFFRDLGLGLEVINSPNILQAIASMAGNPKPSRSVELEM